MSKVEQLAYAVTDVERAAVDVAARLGAGPFFVRHHPPMRAVDGRGAAGWFRHSSAYGQWGDIQLELVAIHGEAPPPGIHHAAWFVDSYDREIERLTAIGWPPVLRAESSSGSRFAFCDARADLGHLVEIYEPTPALVALYAGVRAASRGWDGSWPVRPFDALAGWR